MFQRREERRQTADRALAQAEIARLQYQVTRLERVLRQVIDASDDVVVDMRRDQTDQYGRRGARAGFAEAWTRFEPATSTAEEFFQVGQVDRRARRWLLN